MRLNMFFYVLAAFCVLPFATAKPTKVRLSPHEARAKREQGAAPSFRYRQTTWQEIKARQELRKSPLYKRQQVSAVPTSAPNYPVCNPFRPTTNVARYTATDITTPTASSSTRTVELNCVQACQAYISCKAYVYIPGTRMCYLKTTWSPASFSSTTTNALATGAMAGLIGTTCKDAANTVPATFGAKCCTAVSSTSNA